VEQLLALARQDPDAPVENTAPVDLAQLAASVAHEQEPAAAAKGLVLAAEIAEPVMITGNHDALHAMLDNLVDNAIRYTPSGHVVVRAARGGDDAILEVEDTGPGIPATERTRVFDRFYRSESASQGGSGLGLAIVRRIAERHGGRAELLDAPTGLRVRITLPGR